LIDERRFLGDADAAAKLWDCFFQRLVVLARTEMQFTNRRDADEEDIADHMRANRRLKRGAGLVRGGSVFENDLDVCDESLVDPALLLEMDEQYQVLLNKLPSEILRTIAIRKLEGHDNEEIAVQLGVTARTIQRKLGLIRSFWQKPSTP
jgi:hypothetical protein